jgi:hypothetical protein
MNEIILQLSNNTDIEKAKKEWRPVFHKTNIDIEQLEFGYYYKNKCHYRAGDECRCSNVKREISPITNRPKLYEHCRWVNWRNLNLVDKEDSPYKCICGEPILYVYQIENILNGNRIPETREEPGIGSLCIQTFLPECYTSLQKHVSAIFHEVFPNKYCYNCKKLHRRHNILSEEIVNCRKCPPLCSILDCVNMEHSKHLCKKHLGLKI